MDTRIATPGTIRAIEWTDDGLRLLDQRRLPFEEHYLCLQDTGAVAQAIRDMVVRGAPAIGITAAYAVVLSARRHLECAGDNWRTPLQQDIEMLAAARPTAVNLAWALQRMQRCLAKPDGEPLAALLNEAKCIHASDIESNRRMGEHGAHLLSRGDSVLTHCNTGSLATGGYGTALGVIRSARSTGKLDRVYAAETRPWLQGARLTAWELCRDGIPVDLITDSAAAYLMQTGRVQWVITGADRVTANGDVINKIGTLSLALACRQYGVKMMVVAPRSTLDMNTPDGQQVPIEQRPASEVLSFCGHPLAAEGAQAWNPAFDVTPAGLVDYLVTEAGIVAAPGRGKLMEHAGLSITGGNAG